MIINVEFFDENPIENVITSLNYKIDKTIFFGYKNMLEENKKCTEKVLKEICGVKEVEFYVIDDIDLTGIIDTISDVVEEDLELGHKIFFDLTGGESLPLVAFGILSRELVASMHVYDIYKNKMHEYRYEGSDLLSEVAEYNPISLNLDGFISLYGGTIIYRMHKDFKDTLSKEDIKDIVDVWNLSRTYENKWVYFSALLRKFVPNNDLSVRIEANHFILELKKTPAITKIGLFNRFLDDCEKIGLLRNVCHENGIYAFTYKNASVKNYFWDGGSILEMYTFLKESYENESNDCRVGVHIDWDGIIHNLPGKDVLNEIDIMSIRNNLPTFISCKIGKVDQMALYELETVANRFGGKYARKVLVVANDVASGHMLRAEEMGIEIRKINTVSEEAFM